MNGSTYCGNTVACAVGIASLEVIEEENLSAKAKKMGDLIMNGLKELKHPFIKSVRGKGLMFAIEFDGNYEGVGAKVINGMKAEGVLGKMTGAKCIRFSPALVLTEEDANQIVHSVKVSCDKLL